MAAAWQRQAFDVRGVLPDLLGLLVAEAAVAAAADREHGHRELGPGERLVAPHRLVEGAVVLEGGVKAPRLGVGAGIEVQQLGGEHVLVGGVDGDEVLQEKALLAGDQRLGQAVAGGEEAEMPDERLALRREGRVLVDALVGDRRLHEDGPANVRLVLDRHRVGVPDADVMGDQVELGVGAEAAGELVQGFRHVLPGIRARRPG